MHIKREPVVRVFSAVTGETLSVSGTVFLLSTSVARLMTLVSQQCGLPVSSFRLSSPTGLQLYDCNRLHDYAIDLGATLRLDTWDGWAEFLRGCFLGHRLTVQRHHFQRHQSQTCVCLTKLRPDPHHLTGGLFSPLRPHTQRKRHILFGLGQGTFQQMWISKHEFEEGGKQCEDRKCP
ncbi:protein ANKUB1-like [Oncorhynchus kisutch]|uniref:protein ANKUB1-like n=1 Tax=Oncorhynchus kisutch TaxID=8019 RepID=UPI0012DF53C5|nr:protein ANKUB1-like [Oncorhynchus kisutch]